MPCSVIPGSTAQLFSCCTHRSRTSSNIFLCAVAAGCAREYHAMPCLASNGSCGSGRGCSGLAAQSALRKVAKFNTCSVEQATRACAQSSVRRIEFCATSPGVLTQNLGGLGHGGHIGRAIYRVSPLDGARDLDPRRRPQGASCAGSAACCPPPGPWLLLRRTYMVRPRV